MCDTLVSTTDSSRGGVVLLAKNSDREPNEAQNVTYVPGRTYPAGSEVRCTHISIPQVRQTYSSLLSRPYWMFGAEMGVNEHGVAIGNEAVFTREPLRKKNGHLTGMDMLRLALERSKRASEARDTILELLMRYGQGGAHSLEGTKYYHNSFMIADPEEAFVLETAGSWWVWKKITGIYSISNGLSIGEDYDEGTPGLADYARKKGFIRKGMSLNFTRDFSDKLFTHFARGQVRRCISHDMLFQKIGAVTTGDMMRILRSHAMQEPFKPWKRSMERICLHAGGLISTQTTGSMVAVLAKGSTPLVYLTGTSAPCMSIYKPHLVAGTYAGMGLEKPHLGDGREHDLYGTATDRYDGNTLWWSGEEIHRRVLLNYGSLMPRVVKERESVEEIMIEEIEKKWQSKKNSGLGEVIRKHALSLAGRTHELAENIKSDYEFCDRDKAVPYWFRLQWYRINRKSAFPL